MKKGIVLLFFSLCHMAATAEIVSIVAVPTDWKLQNYVGDNVVAWYTGSDCTNGKLTFGANASKDDKNRFWSLILSAKVANKKAQVYYEDSGAPSSCEIKSFSLMHEGG